MAIFSISLFAAPFLAEKAPQPYGLQRAVVNCTGQLPLAAVRPARDTGLFWESPSMSSIALLFVYSLLCVLASLLGGMIPLVVRLTHTRMQVAISFVSGVMLGIGLLHMVPHSFAMLGSIDQTVLWVLFGFLFMFFLERFFHFHHHDAPEEMPAALEIQERKPLARADQHHDHDHDHGNSPHQHPAAGALPWATAAVGLTLHGLIDGVALAAAVHAEAGLMALAGIGAFLAVFLHKPFDSLTIGTLLAADGRSPAIQVAFNLAYALVTPLGVVLFSLLTIEQGHSGSALGLALAFAGGAFICIAASDLLPELQFHHHDLAALSVALIAGIGLAWSTIYLEAGGHDHLHDHGNHAVPAHTENDDHTHAHSHSPHEHK
jgi:zinc and cadmium transporter